MDFHEYRTIWTPHENEVLVTRIEPTNKRDEFAIAVIGVKDSVIGHLMKDNGGRFAKTIFYFYGEASIMGVELVSQVKLSIKEIIKE